jgi:hypothetical protein
MLVTVYDVVGCQAVILVTAYDVVWMSGCDVGHYLSRSLDVKFNVGHCLLRSLDHKL